MQTQSSLSDFYTPAPDGKKLHSLKYEISKIWNPSFFQGSRKRKQYFEGWYFKNVSAGGKHCWSFIPGISMVGGDPHSFVQAIDGSTGKTYYFRFAAEEFLFSKKGFAAKVGDNAFSREGFRLNLRDENIHITGEVKISELSPYPATLQKPGIMGWYRYVPFMECYHGLVSMDHSLSGSLRINDTTADFTGGRGYLEKDWGSSMPKSWVWMQTNHFEEPNTSFMLSVARIPWIGKTFTGFLGFFHHKGKTLTFATYTGAKITHLDFAENKAQITIKAGKHTLEISGSSRSSGPLKAPVLGEMDRVIHESIDAEIKIRLMDRAGKPVFEGTGKHAGMELVGDLQLLKE